MMSNPKSPTFASTAFAALFNHRQWLLWSLVLMVAGLLVWAGQRIWSGWRAAQVRELGEHASSLIAEGSNDAGVSMLRKAYRMAPEDPSVLRSLAKWCDLSTQDATHAVTLWSRLVQSGAATADDRVEFAKALLATADATGAWTVLASLPPEVRRQPNCADVEAALLREQGRDQEADAVLLAAWKCHADDPNCRLKLARLDYMSPFDDTREEAAKKLWAIARAGESQSAEALLALLSGANCTADDVAEIRQIVRDQPRISPADRLGILGICATKFPLLANEIIAEESSRFQGRPPESCVEFYEWLSKLGDSARILGDLSVPSSDEAGAPRGVPAPRVPGESVFQSRELFLSYSDALVRSGRWEDLASLLDHAGLPVSKIDEELMRTLCASILNKPEAEVEGHLTAALTLAQRMHDSGTLVRVAKIAEKVGRIESAIEATSAITSSSLRLRLENLARIYRWQLRLGDVDGMMATAESILELQPGSKLYVDSLHYFKLLTGTGMESVLDDLRNAPASEEERSLPGRAIIRALAAFRCGNLAESGEWAASVDPAPLPAGQRAVLAGLLVKAGAAVDGVRIAEKIPEALLLPDERWFLQAAMR